MPTRRINPFPRDDRLRTPRGRQYRKYRAVLLATATRCVWCKCLISDALPVGHPRKATADHRIPLSKGGPDVLENLVAACWKCNTSRGNRDAPKPKQTSFRVEGAEEW